MLVDVHATFAVMTNDEVAVDRDRHQRQRGNEYAGALEERQAVAQPAAPDPMSHVRVDRCEP